jgi:hypothetical protein
LFDAEAAGPLLPPVYRMSSDSTVLNATSSRAMPTTVAT